MRVIGLDVAAEAHVMAVVDEGQDLAQGG